MVNFNSYLDKIDMFFLHELCAKEGKLCHYNKGEYFVHKGDTIRYMGFVIKGYFKYSVTDSEGNEHITGFALNNTPVGDYLSTTQQVPCMTDIVAATDVDVLICNCEIMNNKFKENPKLHQLLADSLFHQTYSIYLDTHRLSPKERYIALLKRCPDILENISLKEIASYLNITPTYLSRIRKEITFKNK